MLLAMMARQIRDRFARASPWRAHGMMRPIYDVCALLIALAAVVTPGMAAGVKYAAMSVDANTGNVLHAEAADAPRYPASLTKVMTLYIVFEEMQLGRLRADTQIRISPAAASVPPSRLGLKPGATIDVTDAIRALITKSANDVAVALAEHIAGSEDRFAQRMTRKAHELGMRATTFRNASGLPDPDQVTTARDMLTLALRLYDAFPQDARLFALRSFRYAGRNHRNHNTMLANFAGMDGIKTGYTRASGFNLLASVHRDGRHVMAVVLGGSSATSRNARMRVVLGRGLQQASTERTRRRLVVVAQAAPRPALVTERRPVPVSRRADPPAAAARHVALRQEAGRQDIGRQEVGAGRAVDRSAAWRSDIRLAAPVAPGTSVASRLGTNNGWQPTVASEGARARVPSTLQAQATYLGAASSPFADVRGRRETVSRREAVEIQIGAFGDAGEARDHLRSAQHLSPRLLGDAETAVPTVTVGGRTLYRARFVGLDAGEAASACADLRRRRVDCLVMRSR